MPAGGSPEREDERAETLARIGEAVRERRLELEISSQAALADHAGVVTNTVAFLERGQKMPWMANRRKIEKALGWPSGTLTAMHQGAAAPVLEPVSEPTAPAPPLATAQGAAKLRGRVLSIAVRTSEMAATIAEVAARYSDTDPEAAAAVADIDRHAHELEAVISAGLLDVDLDSEVAFDQLVSALTQLRRGRQAIRNVGRRTV